MHFTFLANCLLAIASLTTAATSTRKLSANAQDLFDYSMALNDARFDESYKLIIYSDNGPWSVRFTAWYIPGLLYRNKGRDLANAKGAIESVLAAQMTENFTSPWYGTWKLSPDEPNPTPNSPLYPPSIYGSYDPNWREFVGVQLVQIVEEFSHLIGNDLVQKILKALEIQAVGAMRRNGTNGDNLVTGYTNPAIMRALTVGWIGARTKNATFIDFANKSGNDILKLFNAGSKVFSEYNAPTYYGVDIWALAASIKYGPKDQSMTKNSPYLLTELWKDIGEHYNAFLGNLAGPYDRANSRDLPHDSAILPLWFWGILGYSNAPEPNQRQANLEYDAAEGSSMAIVMSVVAQHIPSSVLNSLKSFGQERQISKTIRESLDTEDVRVATSWLSKNLMIGGIEANETVVRSKQHVPAIVHWASDPNHKPYPLNGYFSLYPTAATLKAVASKNRLVVSYPNATQPGTKSFQFLITGIPPPWNLAGNVVSGFSKLPCLSAKVSAPGLQLLPTVYGTELYSSLYYNVTYAVPAGFSGIPTVSFDLRYTC